MEAVLGRIEPTLYYDEDRLRTPSLGWECELFQNRDKACRHFCVLKSDIKVCDRRLCKWVCVWLNVGRYTCTASYEDSALRGINVEFPRNRLSKIGCLRVLRYCRGKRHGTREDPHCSGRRRCVVCTIMVLTGNADALSACKSALAPPNFFVGGAKNHSP